MNRRSICLVTMFASALSIAGVAHGENTSGVPVPPVPRFDSKDPARYGKALAYYLDARDEGWRDTYAKATMTLISARGDKVSREVVITTLEQKEGNKSIIRFNSPADIRGIAALIHEHPGGIDDTWLYVPASRRTRRISGANRTASFQGSEFTYEDLSRTVVENYDWKFLEMGTVGKEPVYKLEARPRYKDTGYSRLVVYIHRDHWRSEKVDYYDKAGKLLKTLTESKWKEFHGRFWRGATMTMTNHQTKKATRIDMTAMYVNLALYKRRDGSRRDNLLPDQFTKRALEGN